MEGPVGNYSANSGDSDGSVAMVYNHQDVPFKGSFEVPSSVHKILMNEFYMLATTVRRERKYDTMAVYLFFTTAFISGETKGIIDYAARGSLFCAWWQRGPDARQHRQHLGARGCGGYAHFCGAGQ
jgi:hypothetical protein